MTGPNVRERILPRLIEDELKESFLDYSMSVIVQRALPDVRDGLKPVHRGLLYAMHELGLVPGRPYKKSATVVGDVLGKYHPHGDVALYDSLVRMVQEFSLRCPLVDGQGNFGSVDGDSAAAYRYTDARLTRIAMAMLEDSDKSTVDFVPNFDDRLQEPTVLPSRLPNLIVNGAAGIAVGMAPNIRTHNLAETVEAIKHLVDHPDAPLKELRRFIKGPDFPTGAIIYGREGIKECYEKGRGRIVLRARAIVEEKESTGKQQIVVTEFPYQVSPERVHEQIRDQTLAKKLEGISDVRNESDKEGIRFVIELKRDVVPLVVLNQLYQHTQMQVTFGAIMLALVDGAPKEMNLKELLQHFIEHRHSVITRRTQFELQRAQDREHILEGLKIAVDHIDEVIRIIKKSKDTPAADAALRKRFKLSEKQSAEILNMRLARLTALEITKLEEELRDVRKFIKECKEILASKPRRMKILKEELSELSHGFGDERRTEIVADQGEFSIEDLIAEEDMVITVSHAGYIKRLPVSAYRRQGRDLGDGQGRRLGRAPVHRVDPRLRDVLHPAGAVLLAEGARGPAGGPGRARQADGELHRDQARRADRRARAGAGVLRRPIPAVRDQERRRQEDGAVGVRQPALGRHPRDQHREGRRADRRAGHGREERHRARHPPRHEHPVPRKGRARHGPHRHRGEGDRPREARPRDRHGGGAPQVHAPDRDREGDGQALGARRVPGAAPRRPRHHHAQARREDRRRGRPEGGAPGRRVDDDHEEGDHDPRPGRGHPHLRPQHAGREGHEPDRGRPGGGRGARRQGGGGRGRGGGGGGERQSGAARGRQGQARPEAEAGPEEEVAW